MNVRYQVFVSSTFTDLQEERRHVIDALTKVGYIAVGMEQFPATDEEQMDYIRPIIDESDYYVIIMKGKYGSVDREGVSYTEREFQYAIHRKKPVLAFLFAKTEDLLVSQTDQDPTKAKKLGEFVDLLKSKRIVVLWRDEKDLVNAVKDSLFDLSRRRPSTGWVRGDNAVSAHMLNDLEETRKRNIDLQEENRALKNELEGRDIFMGGDDEITFRFWIVYNDLYDSEKTNRVGPFDYKTTWDRILNHVADILYEEPTEEAVDGFLAKRITRGRQLEAGQYIEFEKDLAQMCRYQFEALGMIETYARKPEDTIWTSIGPAISEPPLLICWRLTAKGKRYISRMKAIYKTIG